MFKVTDNLYRGPRPKNIKELQDIGITHVIDLQSGFLEYMTSDQYEQEKNDLGLNMRFIDYDLSVVFPPKKELVVSILTSMVLIEKMGKLYIHCRVGQDRTGYIMAAYRMTIQGWTYEEAIKEMYSLGFNRLRYFWWTWFLKKYEG